MDRPNIGWVVPSDDGRHGNHRIRVVGGLELSLKFGHHDDLERVDHAARGVGWAPDFDVAHRDWDEAGTGAMIFFLYGYLSTKVSFWLFKILEIQKGCTFSFNDILHLSTIVVNIAIRSRA